MTKTKWRNLTDEEVQYIINNYHNTQTKEILEKLQIPKKHLERMCAKYNLKKDNDFVVIRKDNCLTNEQCQFIIDNYATMSNKEICEILNIEYKKLRSFANRRKLKKENKEFRDNFGSKYSSEILEYVKEKYPNTLTEIMTKEIGLDGNTIRNIAKYLGLHKDKDYKPFCSNGLLTTEQKQFIIDNYPYMKTNDIVKKLGVSYDIIKSYASNKKLKKEPIASKSYNGYWNICEEKRKNKNYNVFDFLGNKEEPKLDTVDLYKSKYGKYYVNQNYFNIIDNEWKAYWLGFLYADGCNFINTNKNGKTKYVIRILLQQSDKEHIQKFLNSVQSNTIIKDRYITLNNKKFMSSDVSICNKQFCLDLERLGCTPKKSLVLIFPNEDLLPKKYYRDFIRGYFDGDGCIHINRDKQNINWSLIGTQEFLSKISDILYDELNIDKNVLIQKKGNKAYCLSHGSLVDIEKIYNYLYKDCNIYLKRKLEKFDTLLCLG